MSDDAPRKRSGMDAVKRVARYRLPREERAPGRTVNNPRYDVDAQAILELLAPDMATAVNRCLACPSDSLNFGSPDHLFERTTYFGEPPDRVFVSLALIVGDEGPLYWHAVMTHPQAGNPAAGLVPVNEWGARAQVNAARARIELTRLDPQIVEATLGDAISFSGAPFLLSEANQCRRAS